MKRKRIFFIVFILLGLIFFLINKMQFKQGISSVRIIDISRYSVTMTWETKKNIRGKIWYRLPGQQEQNISEEKRAFKHFLKLGGLKPDTLYEYRLEKNERPRTFKTAPGKEQAFRFLVASDKTMYQKHELLQKAIKTYLPDFVFLIQNCDSKKYFLDEKRFFDKMKSERLFPFFIVPSFNPSNDLEFQKTIKKNLPNQNDGLNYVLEYGNSRFIVFHPDSVNKKWLLNKIKSKKLDNLFFICGYPEIKNKQFLAKMIKIAHPNAVVSPYLNLNKNLQTHIISANSSFVLIEVDGDGITAEKSSLDMKIKKFITIQETPETVKKSCVYCRRLLEENKYKESIQWYRDFISNFGNRYIVDESQFQIGHIFDRYLYDYPLAVKEYNKLLVKYPSSTRVKQVKQRLSYITTYSDYQYRPLASFEKIKSEIYQKNKKLAIEQARNIIKDYPNSKIIPQVMFWLGHILSKDKPTEAISVFSRLATIEKDSAVLSDIWVATGDVCYAHLKYVKAQFFYNKALKLAKSDRILSIKYKIRKSKRDIKRIIALLFFLFFLSGSYLLILFARPKFLLKQEIMIGVQLLILYLVIGSLGWFVFFRNYPRFFPLIFMLAISFSTVVPFALANTRKKIFFQKNIFFINLILITFFVFMFYYLSLYFFHLLPAIWL